MAKITLSPEGHQRCVQREIKLESTARRLRRMSDSVTFIGIREEWGEARDFKELMLVISYQRTRGVLAPGD